MKSDYLDQGQPRTQGGCTQIVHPPDSNRECAGREFLDQFAWLGLVVVRIKAVDFLTIYSSLNNFRKRCCAPHAQMKVTVAYKTVSIPVDMFPKVHVIWLRRQNSQHLSKSAHVSVIIVNGCVSSFQRPLTTDISTHFDTISQNKAHF